MHHTFVAAQSTCANGTSLNVYTSSPVIDTSLTHLSTAPYLSVSKKGKLKQHLCVFITCTNAASLSLPLEMKS